MRPTRLVWDLAGRPGLPDKLAALLRDVPATCGLCGQQEPRVAKIDRVLGSSFTDRRVMLTRSPWACPACIWAVSGRPPASLRMWSIIAIPGADLGPSNPKAWLLDTPGLLLFNRSNPAPVSALLADPPAGVWLCSIAVSAQKHVLPYAAVNDGPGGWSVRVEDHDVTGDPATWAAVHGAALALRRLGVPAEAVMAGEPRFIRTPDHLAAWRVHGAVLTPYLRSPLLNLALWTITKETMK